MAYFDRYTWHQKNRFLWLGTLVFLLLAYQLAIKKTLSYRKEIKEVNSDESKRIAIVKEFTDLEIKEKQLSLILNKLDPSIHQEKSEIDYLAEAAQAFEVEFNKIQNGKSYEMETSTIGYNTYTFNGSFIKLVEFLNTIEKSGRVFLVHARFKKEVRVPILFLELITVTIDDKY